MKFEWNSDTKSFIYKDSPRVEQIQKKYNQFKKESIELYGEEKLREIMNTFVSAISSYSTKGDYSSNTLKLLAGLNAVEEKLGIPDDKKTTLKSLDNLVSNI